MEETKTQNAEEGKVGESKDSGEGDKSQTVKDTERIRLETEELNKAVAENENAKARIAIGGGTQGGLKPIEAPPETPKEYVLKEFPHL
jgi:hypothetical protein